MNAAVRDPPAQKMENVRPRTGVADAEDGILCADPEPLSRNAVRLRKQQ